MSLDSKIFAAVIAGVIAVIGIAVWNNATCAEWGPPTTAWVTQSCGDGCTTTYPVDTRQCIRRKP